MDLVTVSTVLVEVMVSDEPLGQISIMSMMMMISMPMYSPQRFVVVEEDVGKEDEDVSNDDDENGGAVVVVVVYDVDRMLEMVLEMEPVVEMLEDTGRIEVEAELLGLDEADWLDECDALAE